MFGKFQARLGLLPECARKSSDRSQTNDNS